jgi:16S rRNA (uracil1498-N3)-methyltransferase
MKQSLKFTLPKLNAPVKFRDFINQDFDGTLCIAHCEALGKDVKQAEKKPLKSVVKPAEKITILIGPEGDFSSEEIKKALAKKFLPVSLGESRLRTETAGLVVAQTVSLINE